MAKKSNQKKKEEESESQSESSESEEYSLKRGGQKQQKIVKGQKKIIKKQTQKKQVKKGKKVKKEIEEIKVKKEIEEIKDKKEGINQKKEKKKEQNEQQQQKDNFIIGQKYVTPPDGDGTRAFYESLFEQKPNSKMAQKYCLEYGILLIDEAKRLYNQFQKEIKVKK